MDLGSMLLGIMLLIGWFGVGFYCGWEAKKQADEWKKDEDRYDANR